MDASILHCGLANSLPEGAANGFDSKKGDVRSMLNRTASQAAMMGWQSFNSDVSNQTTGSSASLEMLLNERQVDPEMMLLSLGFGGQAPEYVPTMARVPARFLKQPSQAQGVATPWLSQQESDGVDSCQDGEEENVSGNRSPVAATLQPKRKPGGLVFNGFCYSSCQGYVDLMKLVLIRKVPFHFLNTVGSKCYKVVAEDDDVEEVQESRNKGDGNVVEDEDDCRIFQVSSSIARQEDDQMSDAFWEQNVSSSSVFSNTEPHPGQFKVNKFSKAPGYLPQTLPEMTRTKRHHDSPPNTLGTSNETSRIQIENLTSNPNNESIPKDRCQPLLGSKAAETNEATNRAKIHTTSSFKTGQKANSSLPMKAKSSYALKSDRKVVQKLPSSEVTLKTAARTAVPRTQHLASVTKTNTISTLPSSSSSSNPATTYHNSYDDKKGEKRGFGSHSVKEPVKQKNAAFRYFSKWIHGKGKTSVGSGDMTPAKEEDAKPLSKVVELEETESETCQHYFAEPEIRSDTQMPKIMPVESDSTIEEQTLLKTVHTDQMQATPKSNELSTQMQTPLQSSCITSGSIGNIIPGEVSLQEAFDGTEENNDILDETFSMSNQHNDLLDSTLESLTNKIVASNPMSQELVCRVDVTEGTFDDSESEDVGDNDDSYDWVEDDEDQEDSDGNEAVHDLRSLNEMLYRIDGSSPELALHNALSDDDLKESDSEIERDSDFPQRSDLNEEPRRISLHSENENDVMLSEGKHSNGVHDLCARISSTCANSTFPSSMDAASHQNPSNVIVSNIVSSHLTSPTSADCGPMIEMRTLEARENHETDPCWSLPDDPGTLRFSSRLPTSNCNVSSSPGRAAVSFLPQTPVVVTVRVVGDIRVSCVPSQKLRMTDSSNLSSPSTIQSVTGDVIAEAAAIQKKPCTPLKTDPTFGISKENVPMSYKSEISSFSLKRPKSSDVVRRASSVSSDKPVSSHLAVFSTHVGCSLPVLTTTTPSSTVVYSALHMAPTLSSASSSSSLLSPSKRDFRYGASGLNGAIDYNDETMQKSSDFSEMDSSFLISSSSGSDEEDDNIVMLSNDRHGL